MDGVIFFGAHSIDIASWIDKPKIETSLTALKELIGQVNGSQYASVKVPAGWDTYLINSNDFWGEISNVVAGQNDLLAFILKELYDQTFSQCIDNHRSFEDAVAALKNANPNVEQEEYYGALQTGARWPGIADDDHVSNREKLYNLALKNLRETPLSESNYALRCTKVFRNLVFDTSFEEKLEGHGTVSAVSNYAQAPETGIAGFSVAVTRCLSTLNSIVLAGKNTQTILAEIQAGCGFKCTPQGGNKEGLEFSGINCEYHIKISKNNKSDGVFYQDRLYFGFFHDGETKKIYVARSGQHV